MSRSPVYHEKNNHLRVISVHNERWVFQTKTNNSWDNFSDNWTSQAHPTTQEMALEQMAAHYAKITNVVVEQTLVAAA
jgi:hypothetical protein